MSRPSWRSRNRANIEREEAEKRAQRDASISRLSGQTRSLQDKINAQARASRTLGRNLRREANVRFTEYDKDFSEMQSDWMAFEDRQNRIVERKTEADEARDAKWKDVVDEAERNPLAEFQNAKGNLGLKGYQAAKDAGWTARNISDYTNIGSYTQGMTMGDEARKQYDIDIAPEDPTWTDLERTPLRGINRRIKEPLASLGAGHTYSSVVSKGGNIGGGEGLKISPGKGPTDINALKRKTWNMAAVNAGSTSGKASNSSSVNV